MIAPLVFRHASQCLTLKHTKSIGLAESIYDLPTILPNHPEKHPMTIRFVSRWQPQPPAVRVASSTPEARRRCITRLGKAMPPWSSSWSLRGPRWTRPIETAVAPEGFSGCFASSYMGSWFSCFALGIFGMLSGTCCLRIHFCAGMGLLQFGYKRPNMEGKSMSGMESRRM